MVMFTDPQAHDVLRWLKSAPMKDRLNGAHGVLNFQILADPNQPRVRGLQIETAGGTFALAIDAKVAMGLATALISAALAIDPTLKEAFVEHVNKS
jgi:hypothetical protein